MERIKGNYMKKWQLKEARKYLAKIVDDVLQGEV